MTFDRSLNQAVLAPKPNCESHLEVKMREIERDVSARLDTKMAALEQLIIAADAATARLDTTLDKSKLAGRATGD